MTTKEIKEYADLYGFGVSLELLKREGFNYVSYNIMKKLEICGREVSIDIDKLSRGLCDLHNDDEGMRAVLAFGMLDAKLCEMFEKNLSAAVKKEFGNHLVSLFPDRINQFINDCNNEITKGVYQHATMIV